MIKKFNQFKVNESTTFGIKVGDDIVPIAKRVGGSDGAKMFFTYQLDELLEGDGKFIINDKTKVYPIDNTSQGIETIGDIKKFINSAT